MDCDELEKDQKMQKESCGSGGNANESEVNTNQEVEDGEVVMEKLEKQSEEKGEEEDGSSSKSSERSALQDVPKSKLIVKQKKRKFVSFSHMLVRPDVLMDAEPVVRRVIRISKPVGHRRFTLSQLATQPVVRLERLNLQKCKLHGFEALLKPN